MLHVWSVIDILFKNSFLFVGFWIVLRFFFSFYLKKALPVCLFMLFGEVGGGGGGGGGEREEGSLVVAIVWSDVVIRPARFGLLR